MDTLYNHEILNKFIIFYHKILGGTNNILSPLTKLITKVGGDTSPPPINSVPAHSNCNV